MNKGERGVSPEGSRGHLGPEVGPALQYGKEGGSCGGQRGRVVLDFLEYPEERDEEIGAIHQQTDAHQADERDLIVA